MVKRKVDAEAQVRDVLRELAIAHMINDATALARLYADDLTYFDCLGKSLCKAECLAGVESGEFDYDAWDSDEVLVRDYGDTAVVTSLAAVNGRHQGLDISGRYRLTLVLVKTGGDWKIIVGHETQVDGNHFSAAAARSHAR